MNNQKNITIGALCLCAAILLAAVITLNSSSATATTSESRAGDYIAVTGSISGSTDILYVIDVSVQRLNGYACNRNTGAVEMLNGATIDLAAAFETKAPAR